MPGDRTAGIFPCDHGGQFHANPQGNGFDRPGRIATRGGVAFHARFRAQGIEIHADDAADRVDRRHALTPGRQRLAARLFDSRDVRRHLGPDGLLRGGHDPFAHFAQQFRILTHGHAHFSLGQAVRTGKVEFEGIHPGLLTPFDDLDPGILVVFLHDRGDEDAFRVGVLGFLEFLQPDGKRPVADQFDVFPANDLRLVLREQLAIARSDIDDLGGVEADRLGNDAAPAFTEGAVDDVQVGPGRAGGNDKRVLEFQSVNGGGKRRHDRASGAAWVILRCFPGKNRNFGARSAPNRFVHFQFPDESAQTSTALLPEHIPEVTGRKTGETGEMCD